MITYAKNLIRSRHPLRITYGSRLHFSQINKNEPDKTQTNKKQQKGVSLKDMFTFVKNHGKSAWDYFYPMKWPSLVGLAALLGGAFYVLQPQQQQYPINFFQQQVRGYERKQNNLALPKKGLSNVKVIVEVLPDKVNYKVQFSRNDHVYTVNYKDQTLRFKKIQKILQAQANIFNLKYEYIPNLEVTFSKFYLMAQLISIIFITGFFVRSTRMSSVTKSNKSSNIMETIGQKKSFEVITQTKVKFKDVAGLDQSKVQVQQFVDFLKNPQKYKKLGARIPKGVLLSGPPGTGKTMLAKACAGEAGVPFIPVSGSDFVQIFVGVGAARVRDLFATAKEKSPSIIFIDQIDAVGRKRSGSHGSHDERDNTLNQILVEMDGFETDKNVIVMAATNRQNLLDSALIRPGRFDRIVEINLPDLEGRRQIFNVHLSKIKMDSSRTKQEYAKRLATLTPGFSGAQIANLCNEAAILAARNGKSQVDSHDLQMATQRIIGGIERKSIITKQQKKVVSVHQSGHAVVSWFLKGADPLLKLTIIPRSKGSLGFAQYFVNETKLHTKTQLIDRICFILGGRCAEQLFFGKVTNGAADDLKKAYELAHNYVVKLGMSDQLGLVAYKDPQFLRPYSQQMGTKIDNQIKRILKQCTQRTKKLVRQHEHHIKNLSQQLFEKQTLTIREIRRILGERDFTSNQTYQKYLQMQRELDQLVKQKL